MSYPFTAGGTEEPRVLERNRQKDFSPLLQANDIHVHNNLMKNNFNIEIAGEAFN